MNLILARHGETRLNRDGRIQGRGRARLTVRGKAQARALAKALAADLPFALYSSPATRAMQTARAISRAAETPITPMPELEEADAGELEGLSGREMRERYPEFVRCWDEDAGSARMPGGESLRQVQDRAWPAIVELSARHRDETVVAVTHNFTIQAIVCRALEMPLRNGRRLRQQVGAMTRLAFIGDDASLVSLNEIWHLASLPTQK